MARPTFHLHETCRWKCHHQLRTPGYEETQRQVNERFGRRWRNIANSHAIRGGARFWDYMWDGLLTGKSVLVFLGRRRRCFNANRHANNRIDLQPSGPEFRPQLGTLQSDSTWIQALPAPSVDSVAVSVWWNSHETQRDHTRTAKDEHTCSS